MNITFKTSELQEQIINDKTHYKVIILIIASHNEAYDLFKLCWKEYMNSFQNVKSYFLYSDPNIENDVYITEDTITHKSVESVVPGILFKTTAGMSFCNNYFSYDYLLRTNLSSFYHIPRLLSYLETRPNLNYAGSQFYNLPNDPSKFNEQKIVNEHLGIELNDKFIFLHGAGFILSKDVVDNYINVLITNYDKLKPILLLPDDVAISIILYSFLTLPPKDSQFSYYHPTEFENIYHLKHQCKGLEEPSEYQNENIFHFRNKIDDSCMDNTLYVRNTDTFNYVKQIRYFYNKPEFMKDIFYDGVEKEILSFRPRMIDCFIFYNELDMLFYRLTVLNEVVDFFVLVESTRTHTGNIKPLYYNENKHLFEKFNNKIIHIVVDDLIIPDISKDEQWKNENYQRNCIERGIKCLGLKDKDYIIICDVDEIPNQILLNQFKDKLNNEKFDYVALKQDFYYYNLNYKINEIWTHPKLIRYDAYLNMGSSPQNIRMSNCRFVADRGGWHLSYFGDSSFIKNKLENFTHQEFNNAEIVNIDNLQAKMENGVDILNRPDVSLERIPISENRHLPPLHDTMLKKFILF